MVDSPHLEHFRLEHRDNGIVHLVFDAPGRSMNVFSNAAIHELGAFAAWLADADVRGVVIRSGKASGFCAGADLSELGVAYDMIVAAPPARRFNVAFDHFFPLSAAIRAMETSGKPVAAAIEGIALGGGCELALGAHYRVIVDHPAAALGVPESLVGLLPGAGGTQRLPRLIGIDAALPLLLEGKRLAGEAARASGLVHEVVAPGKEVEAAEAWLLGAPDAWQPWDRPGWTSPSSVEVGQRIAHERTRVLSETLGHYPAPLAILDCVEFGLPQCFDGAIRSEMAIFSHLIQREEPRNMIHGLFLGRTDFDRARKASGPPAFVAEIVGAVRDALAGAPVSRDDLMRAGFKVEGGPAADAVRTRAAAGYWFEEDKTDASRAAVCATLSKIDEAIAPWRDKLTADERRLADFAVIQQAGYPGYLGGPFLFGARQRSS